MPQRDMQRPPQQRHRCEVRHATPRKHLEQAQNRRTGGRQLESPHQVCSCQRTDLTTVSLEETLLTQTRQDKHYHVCWTARQWKDNHLQ